MSLVDLQYPLRSPLHDNNAGGGGAGSGSTSNSFYSLPRDSAASAFRDSVDFGDSVDTFYAPPAERPKVNKQNEARIAALNSLDVELYAFVEDLFWAKAEACGALSTEEGEGGNISTTESAPLALVDAHRRHLFRFL